MPGGNEKSSAKGVYLSVSSRWQHDLCAPVNELVSAVTEPGS